MHVIRGWGVEAMQRCRHRALSALAVFLISSLCVACQYQEAEQQCLIDEEPQVAHWIVRFKAYDSHEHLCAYLSQGLEGLGDGSWFWVDRENLASSIPTDFALLAINSTLQPALSHALLQLPLVRDMHPDRRLQGSLKWVPEGQLADAMGKGAGADGAAFNDEGEVAGQDLPRSGDGEAEGMVDEGSVENNEIRAHGAAGGKDVEFDVSVTKRPGRFSTPFMMQPEDDDGEGSDGGWEGVYDVGEMDEEESWRRGSGSADGEEHSDSGGGQSQEEVSSSRRRRLLGRISATSLLQADRIWGLGYSGHGVKVGVFDTGIHAAHPHVRNIKGRSDWTHQRAFSDGLGHGSFVAGVISSNSKECPGFAPDVELHTFKVFTDDQVSYTSWFLDAFNYAIFSKVNIINLSIGGPDFLDHPFVDKVLEVTSNGIMMVSAIGNDGPLFGTLNNPADQNDVIGVGGIDDNNNIAGFSSRGMTTWELPTGFGRVKPDVMAYAKDVTGSKMQTGCRSLSGTSVASPVAAGAVCLLASTVPEQRRWSVLNPASMKQALIEGADRLQRLSMYEQGAGRINLLKSMKILQDYQVRASVVPASLDLEQCPYSWPYCLQPLYTGGLPLVFNATVLNGMGVSGKFVGKPTFKATNDAGKHLHFEFEHSEVLWPWSGYLALFIHVLPSGKDVSASATAEVSFSITSPAGPNEDAPRTSSVTMPIKARIEPTPPRFKRVLWDQFHSIKYPPGYIPRDNLDIKHDVLDWHGDHLYTNYHKLLNFLRGKKYFVEVLSSPLTCFDASQYGALIIADAEEEYYAEEVAKIKEDVEVHGLNLVVFGEWYNLENIRKMRFFDDNTRSWWTPVTGGANVPALNDLLAPFGVAFGDALLVGTLNVAGTRAQVSHGADIARMPQSSVLHTVSINNMATKPPEGKHGVLGVAPVGSNKGHVVMFGDSNCLDSSHQRSNCFDFLVRILEHVTEGHVNGIAPDSARLGAPYEKQGFVPPKRRPDLDFSAYSWVLTHELKCYANTHCAYHSCAAPWEPARPSAFMQGRGTWAGAVVRASDAGGSDTTSRGRIASEAKAEDRGMVGSSGSGNQDGVVRGAGGRGEDPGRGAGEGGSLGEGTPSAQQQQQQGSQARQGDAPSIEHATIANVGTGMGMGSLTALVCFVCVVGLVGVFGLYRFRRRPPSRAVIKGPLI